MAAKLAVADNDIILEPSAGEGIFIDKVMETGKRVQVDALDIDSKAAAFLKKKYENNGAVVVRKTDTLFDEQLDIYSSSGHYSKVIGNPPYGAWQDYEKRKALKKKYAGQYVKETYSLFLLRCLSVLKMHGRLSFIIPDTYLFLNMHARLREVLFRNAKIDEILIFPSRFFPGVSFGYSNLSIITLERCGEKEALNNAFKIIQGFKSSSELTLLLQNSNKLPEHLRVFHFKQGDLLSDKLCRVRLAETKTLTILSDNAKKLGDAADVVTGFYTGDNLHFIKAADKKVKGSKNYEIVDPGQVSHCTSLYGIPDVKEGYVPYIKSASARRYVRQRDEWFVRWDKGAIDFYHSNQKSRFQNSAFYFKTGIGIPMVKSSTIRAFLMEGHVFDQSIVGIFPKDRSMLYYLLALMNSDVINTFIHVINPTANNSANYVKQLPYMEPDKKLLMKINDKVREVISLERSEAYDKADSLHKEINSIIGQIYEEGNTPVSLKRGSRSEEIL